MIVIITMIIICFFTFPLVSCGSSGKTPEEIMIMMTIRIMIMVIMTIMMMKVGICLYDEGWEYDTVNDDDDNDDDDDDDYGCGLWL